MANTTSGTATFDKTFAIDEIVEESFERIGLQNVAGYQLKSARRSLNILFQEWGNRGIHYWEIDELDLDLIEGQAEYDFFRSSDDGTSATSTPNGVASSVVVLRDISSGSSGDKVFEADFGTEGLDIYVPGNGIRFENGVHATMTNTTSLTIGYTG